MAAITQEVYFGQCKCCQKQTRLKNMWFTGNKQTEVYGQMLIDCFSIDWMIQGNIDDDKICEECISQLQLAVKFKNRVLKSQAGILGSRNAEERIMEVEDIKEELVQEETSFNGEQSEDEDGVIEFLEEEVLDEETNEDSQDSEPAQKKRKWPKKLPTSERYKSYRQYTEEDLKKAVEAVKSKEMSSVKASEVFNIPRKTISKRIYDNTERVDLFNAKELVKAIRAILKHTNATPFRIKLRYYSCYFCPCYVTGFENPEDLREHTQIAHNNKVVQIEFAIRPHHMNQMIRFDITDLTCDCGEEVTWPDMLEHLETTHNVTDINDAWKKIVPFTLTKSPRRENPCALCEYTGCFSRLDNHMNIHYKNFICGDCGKPFVTLQRLKSHEFYHEWREFKCNICQEVFTNPKSRRQHVNTVHEKKLTFKCVVCSERFLNERLKLMHLKTEHQDSVESYGMNCEFCNKSFWAKDYWRHMRRKHSKFLCDKCNKRYESQKMLDEHICKGSDNEVVKYQCDLCFKQYLTVKAVITHKESCGKKETT